MNDKVIKQQSRRLRVSNALQREGHAAVRDEEWQYAVDQRWSEGPDEPGLIAGIVVNLVDARRRFGSDRQERAEIARLDRGVPGARKYALSLLLAEQARIRRDVAEFRRKHFAGRLLEIGTVQRWVRQKAAEE